MFCPLCACCHRISITVFVLSSLMSVGFNLARQAGLSYSSHEEGCSPRFALQPLELFFLSLELGLVSFDNITVVILINNGNDVLTVIF